MNGESSEHRPKRPFATGEDDEAWRIGAVLTNESNRELLREWLGSAYDVATPNPARESPDAVADATDLLVLDAGAYERYADWIAAYQQGETTFRPVLLLVGNEDSVASPDLWEHVDDIVSIPVEKAVLHARIRGLLRRRELTRDLARSENRFRTLFDTAPDPAFVLSEAGMVVDTNAPFRELVGVSAADCRDRPLSSFDAFDAAVTETMATLGSLDTDDEKRVLSYRTEDGETRYAEYNTTDLDAPRGPAAQRIVILRDVTERVHHERELQRQVDRLDEFAGVLAHEMRNPLSIASGWLEQARTTGDAAAFDRVDTAHDRMSEMIDELLRLARGGMVIDQQTTVPLAELVTDAWASLSTGDATLSIESAVESRTVTGDRDRLREVFTNLFRNAVEHGGPDVTVSVGLCDDGDGVYVADDGPGLGDIDRELVFESGYTTATDGTGFGLPIVEQIVEAHGWSIRAADAEGGGGARFEIQDMTSLDDSDVAADTECERTPDGRPADTEATSPATPGSTSRPTDVSDAFETPFQAMATNVLDTLPLNVAVLDSDGVIVGSNRAWRTFGVANGLESRPESVGVDYLAVTEAADDEDAQAAAEGIRAVLAGERDRFTLEYPCHSSSERRWFLLHVASFEYGGETFATVAHLDVTERKRAELAAEDRQR